MHILKYIILTLLTNRYFSNIVLIYYEYFFIREISQRKKIKRKAKHKIHLEVKAKLDIIWKRTVDHIIIMKLNTIKKKKETNTIKIKYKN